MTGDPTIEGMTYRSERKLLSFFASDLCSVFPSIDWNPVTKEDVLHSDDKYVIYAASKKYAELAVWEWAEAHPDVDVTTSKSMILSFL